MSSPATTPMSRDQQFCLRWNNYQSNLIQVFNQLFQTESFVDVTLACEGHSVKAHRMVLSACSPYFQNVLLEAPCSHPVIILQGVKWSELKAIVEFIYKGEININQDQLGSLLRVAESLKIRGLADVGGEEAEAVLTSPSSSPRVNSQFWSEENPRKRRRLSDERRTRSRSRSRSPRPSSHTPPSAAEVLDSLVDLQGPLSRGSSSASNPPPSLPSLPSPSPVASLANSLSSFAHFHAPMPPPGPPLPPHLAHLPPLSPLSPLLNMHPMPRHHSPEDFEIRPGIAEMIREEERVSSLMNHQQNPEKYGYNLAKLLESTHHWMANPMADSYQAQVQAAWQKSWNQTQSLLQNLRFRERGPLKSWRPETMADAIHAVLKEGLSLSQAARKYDIPYPTFVLYANRVHNLLGPSHEPGDMRPKGRGRPQRILLGSWPEDQIKGVIKAVVFRDTAVFRAGEHKENKKPAPPQIKEEPTGLIHGPFTPNPSLTPNGTSDKSGASTPIPPSTPGTSQPLPPGSIMPPITTSPLPGFNVLPSSSPMTKQEPCNMSPTEEMQSGNPNPPSSSSSSSGSTPGPILSSPSTPTTLSSTVQMGSHTPQSRPSSASSIGNGPQQNGLQHSLSNVLSHSIANNNNNSINLANSAVSNLASKMNGSANHSALSPTFFNGGIPLPPVNTLTQLSPQQSKSAQHSPTSQQKHQQSTISDSPHINHQSALHNSQLSQRNPYSQVNHQLSNQQRHPQTVLPPSMTGPQQQMLGLLAGGLSPALQNNPVHMARLFSEAPHLTPRPQHPMNAFHPSFARHGHPGMQNIGIHGSLNAVGQRMASDEAEPSPEALLFGKIASAERHSYNQSGIDIGARNLSGGSFEGVVDQSPNSMERPLMFRDGLDAIKSEPEAIMN